MSNLEAMFSKPDIRKASKDAGLSLRLQSKKRKMFNLSKSLNELSYILKDELPAFDECYKLISFDGGFSSISLINYICDREAVKELTASSLRVGEKQMDTMNTLHKNGKLDKASFIVGTIMKEDEKKLGKYNYYKKFKDICEMNEWKTFTINNHSKILLLRTDENFYVIETSSNLNENPKIEQYSFENSEELYNFYYDFFKVLKARC